MRSDHSDSYNSAFNKAFNDYASIVFYNGFMYGFIAGTAVTSFIFILRR